MRAPFLPSGSLAICTMISWPCFNMSAISCVRRGCCGRPWLCPPLCPCWGRRLPPRSSRRPLRSRPPRWNQRRPCVRVRTRQERSCLLLLLPLLPVPAPLPRNLPRVLRSRVPRRDDRRGLRDPHVSRTRLLPRSRQPRQTRVAAHRGPHRHLERRQCVRLAPRLLPPSNPREGVLRDARLRDG